MTHELLGIEISVRNDVPLIFHTRAYPNGLVAPNRLYIFCYKRVYVSVTARLESLAILLNGKLLVK